LVGHVSGTIVNANAFGYSASVNASNKIRLGNTAVTVIEGQVAYTFPSDGRFKTSVKADAPGLAFIQNLRPVTYHFDYAKFSDFLGERKADKDALRKREEQLEMGFIAQEVEAACQKAGVPMANLVHAPDGEKDNYSMAYGQLTVPLVKAVQELSKALDEKDAEIAALKADVAALKAAVQGVLQAQGEKK
jgi:trimeric autotransporter adhesin